MIEPTQFGFNEETFKTNSFQQRPAKNNIASIQQQALNEFTEFVTKLKALHVKVLVHIDTSNSNTPDSIFPNNWFSTHRTGELILYPMAVANRRAERREDIINSLIGRFNFTKSDLSANESENPAKYLEGTGSMVFDHNNKVIYGAISSRTNKILLEEVANKLGYKSITFKSYGKDNELIYHTNVMLCIGDTYAVIGDLTINEVDRPKVIQRLIEGGKEVIHLTNEQVYNQFAGNMLQIQNNKGESILVLSESAFTSLTDEQLGALQKHNDHILNVSIPTIEKVGGGSARCMIAEIFIPEK